VGKNTAKEARFPVLLSPELRKRAGTAEGQMEEDASMEWFSKCSVA